MDRERMEREQRERELRECEEQLGGSSHMQLVNQHFEDSFRFASKKNHPGVWSQHLTSISVATDPRDIRQHQHPMPIHFSSPQHHENLRIQKDSDQFVQESIYKAFRADDPAANDPNLKLRKAPPPAHAHAKVPSEIPQHLPGYSQFLFEKKDVKIPMDRNYPLQQHSVLLQQHEKVPQLSVSPKQRPMERLSPYSNVIAASSHYKPYEPASIRRATSQPHPRLSPNLHNVELTKVKPPFPSNMSQSISSERYYSPISEPSSNLYQSSNLQITSASIKPKVPIPQMYGKPGITPLCKVTRNYNQPVCPTIMVAGDKGPPPAHSGNRNHNSLPLPTSHDQRLSHKNSPFDNRLYHGPGNPKAIPGSLVPNNSSIPEISAAHISCHNVQQLDQSQPLDLGTKDGGASVQARQNPVAPPPPEMKKTWFENSAAAVLARVTEPVSLYPTAIKTITTVENRAALDHQRLAANLSYNFAHGSGHVVGNASDPAVSLKSEFSFSINDSPRAQSLPPPDSSPKTEIKAGELEKTGSPNSAACSYMHKLKKTWLQRHESGTEPMLEPENQDTSALPTAKMLWEAGFSSTAGIGRKKSSQKSALNGLEPDRYDDSSTSDSENGIRVKRPKMEESSVKAVKRSSETNSDSDKESDGGESSSKMLDMKHDLEPKKKRGRKPKIKQENVNDPKPLTLKNDPLRKPSISQLKKTLASFLQDCSCYEVAPKLPKCRECRWTAHQRSKKMPNIFCRFYAFRRLKYNKNGQLMVAGFSDPVKDACAEDLSLWIPNPSAPAPDLDVEMSKFLLSHVGDQFCDLVHQEKEAMALHMGADKTVAWKRVVQGVREMCDVCETTLFNIHWACSKCGFVVCIDCYRGRKEGTIKMWNVEGTKETDKYSWLLCTSKVPHEQDQLMLTQIIAGMSLVELGNKMHEARYKWGLPMYCDCEEAKHYKEKELEDKKLNGINKDLIKNFNKESKPDLLNGKSASERVSGTDEEVSNSPLNFFAEVALSNEKKESEVSSSDSDSDSDDKGQSSTLRELLIRSSGKEDKLAAKNKEASKKKAKLDTLDDVISCVIERNVEKDSNKDIMKVELKHFIRKYNYSKKGREALPIRIMTKTESRLLYPNIPHSWLCDGKLLRLHDPLHADNVKVFQDLWKRGQPVLVCGVGQSLNSELWKPSSFSRDFGDIKNNLINCLTDNIVPNQPMRKFWDGFEYFGKRLKDDKGQPMILKLKDWPPGDDFAEILPSRFEDLMKVLPMGEYTRRNGILNLAGRLPDCFVRPDLGPKMYIAYGSASYPGKASTNLHLDISDAVNVMCFVGLPKDLEYEESIRDTFKAIDEAGCDILTRQRVREKGELPGALWHIYHSRDADKIRDLLNKVAIEKGKKLEPFHDPIHDQSWYLDGPFRERLYKEYAVEGYAIIQCMGDAVFVPAGAPHQVRNLQNCVKIAEDFVSPENVSHCFHLTQEFRHLSDTHTNHEDKLQIKNIIYHAVKDSLSTLIASEQSVSKSES